MDYHLINYMFKVSIKFKIVSAKHLLRDVHRDHGKQTEIY